MKTYNQLPTAITSNVLYTNPLISPLCFIRHRSSDIDLKEDDHTINYYGGLKGHILKFKNGKFHQIIKNENVTENSLAVQRQGPVAAASSSIAMTTYHDHDYTTDKQSTFVEDFNKIQLAAARLVALQEIAKRKGNFSPEDNRIYAASLLELGEAAQNLAKLQQSGEINDFSILLQPVQSIVIPHKTPLNGNKIEEENEVTIANIIEEQKVDEVTEQQLSESDLLPPNNEDPYEDVNDSVAVTLPKKDASVAEAKPVGVSIVGEGGVASSKPNAVALSGRNGLAISAPKATAIAGVTAEEAAAFNIALPTRNNLIIKSPSSSSNYGDTHNILLLRSADTMKTKKSTPMISTVKTADDIVEMWRTAIAEDHAADNADHEHNQD